MSEDIEDIEDIRQRAEDKEIEETWRPKRRISRMSELEETEELYVKEYLAHKDLKKKIEALIEKWEKRIEKSDNPQTAREQIEGFMLMENTIDLQNLIDKGRGKDE